MPGSKRMKQIEIPEDLHDLISAYCFFHKIKIKEFATIVFESNKELQSFKTRAKLMRFS